MTTAVAAVMTPLLDMMQAQIITAMRHSVTEEFLAERAGKALLLDLVQKTGMAVQTVVSRIEYSSSPEKAIEAEALALLAMSNLTDLLMYRQATRLAASIVVPLDADFEVEV